MIRGYYCYMPSKHRVKEYAENAYYHVFNRGVAKRVIFKDEDDYTVFLNLLKRYLSARPTQDSKGRDYPWLSEEVEVNAFCLMPNHFHLLIYQKDAVGMTKLLSGVCTAYSMYFNRKYKRVGPLFQGRFKASRIDDEAYLEHISRYIHLNPRDYRSWQFSSLPYYLGERSAEWLQTWRITEIFESAKEYLAFIADYKEHQSMLEEIKNELADHH